MSPEDVPVSSISITVDPTHPHMATAAVIIYNITRNPFAKWNYILTYIRTITSRVDKLSSSYLAIVINMYSTATGKRVAIGLCRLTRTLPAAVTLTAPSPHTGSLLPLHPDVPATTILHSPSFLTTSHLNRPCSIRIDGELA